MTFSPNSEENINRLVEVCGELLNGTCALYNRLQSDELCSVGQWRTPPGFRAVDLSEGHICHDVIREGKDTPVILRHVQKTPYVRTDPNVSLYGLNTYIGLAVKWRQVAVGSLCVVYQADVEPSPEDLHILKIIAAAIGVEEERRRSEKEVLALQEQLRQSQKMEAIGHLAGGIAHDFNNILTVINGRCEMALLKRVEGDPLWAGIEEIKKASERATSLTRQLLAFSRRQILELKVLDLNSILLDLNKMLRRVIGEDIELVHLLAKDLGKVKSDPGQIEQVILNLAVNARDAMPNGGRLILETSNVELDEGYARDHVGVKPGPYVRLSVSDTGLGMTREVKERIFEPFFTTKEMGKGTGMGLSTVYGIVKQSGGNIWVYSEVGRGTVFKIYLPQVDELADRLDERAEEEEAPRGKETILLVEDDGEVRRLTASFLTEQGYKVLEASDESDAFPVCRGYNGPIKLMLTDVVMPGMNGRELARHLLSLRPEMKVLYMSGYTDDAIVHHGVLERGLEFLQKPFTLIGLAKKVREVLDKDSKPAG
jgi:two-component system, cell cycle sensor histidine kinase and response regulator CckA